MDLSVVVCTKDRSNQLPAFFENLEKLSFSNVNVELIFIDNGSMDNTIHVLESLSKNVRFTNVLIMSHLGSLSSAKNFGLSQARADLVAFTDDDCYPDADWCLNIIHTFSEDTEKQLICGHVRLHDNDDHPITVTIERLVQPVIFPYQIMTASIHGCNIAVRRRFLQGIQGFDELLGPGTPSSASEDRDLFYRAAKECGFIYYRDNIRVQHKHGRRTDNEVSKLKEAYRRGESAFLYKYAARLDIRAIKMVAKVFYWQYDKRKNSEVVIFFWVIKDLVTALNYGFKLYRVPHARGPEIRTTPSHAG